MATNHSKQLTDMAVAASYLPCYTYADYQHWEGRWEIIEGVPYAMSPMAAPRHQRVSARLNFLFEKALEGVCEVCKVYPPLDYKVSEETVVQPDLLVVCQEITKPFLDFPPELVVEILSPSTVRKDRGLKYDIYQGQQISYYLIIDPQERVEVYQIDAETYVYRLAQSGKDFPYLFYFGRCEVEIDFRELWKA